LEEGVDTNDRNLYASMEKWRSLQKERYVWYSLDRNSQVDGKYFSKFIQLTPEAELFVREYAERMILSARVVHKICKVARTIADLEWSEQITKQHIAEATYYRGKTMFVGD
jgi:magnesium chelatase family protein